MHEVCLIPSRFTPPGQPPSGGHVPRVRCWNRPGAVAPQVLLGVCCVLLAGCHLHRADSSSGDQAPAASIHAATKVSVGPAANALPGNRPAATAASVPAAIRELRVGEVRVIGGERRFVLVEVTQRSGLPLLSPGLELRCRAPASSAVGGEQTATLRVSPERRQPFIVADVLDGEPHVNDTVYYSAENQTHLLPTLLAPPLSSPPATAPVSSSLDLHP